MRFCRICLFSVAIFFTCFFLISAYAQSNDLKEFFPMQEGNSWLYEKTSIEDNNVTTTFEEERIEGVENINGIETRRLFIGKEGDYDAIAIDQEGVKLYKRVSENKSTVNIPAEILLPFGIENGSVCKYEFSYTGYDKIGQERLKGEAKLEVKFEGKEDIKVPGGDFSDCIKISKILSFSSNDGDFGEDREHLWFAKNIGVVKKEISFSENFNSDVIVDMWECKLKSAVIDNKKYGMQ